MHIVHWCNVNVGLNQAHPLHSVCPTKLEVRVEQCQIPQAGLEGMRVGGEGL